MNVSVVDVRMRRIGGLFYCLAVWHSEEAHVFCVEANSKSFGSPILKNVVKVDC